MGTQLSCRLEAQLAGLKERLEGWRSSSNRNSRIPEELWTAAVEVARQCGLAPTARALHLDYYSLKHRLEGDKALARQPLPAFVEVLPPRVARIAECVVELEDAQGTRLRISLKGSGISELTALVQALRKEGA
jgi:hypothetical protein